ncbi:MAG: hypothetical protein GWM93_17070 [Gemmatimonadetes bacterium]|nr:pilus assembly protein [Gemmatimonadota bacterium]NIT68368.1 pilus assembly protein [Gemmatimonadota bacterium]NIY36945.1 hypothetical protein [Gemmatimonadota bacterium]
MLTKAARWLGLLKDRRGTAFVEFGLIAPILFLVVLGIIDFGRLLWLSNTVEHAAVEGARYAAVHGAGKPTVASADQIIDYVRARADGIRPSDLTIAVTWDPDNTDGSTVTIQASYDFDFFMVGFLPLDPMQLNGSSTMVIN